MDDERMFGATRCMSHEELVQLYAVATEARNLAHEAYKTALRNRQAPGDTYAAFQTLLATNRVRNRIYNATLALALEGAHLQ